MVRPSYGGGFLGFESDNRKRVSVSGESELSRGADGGSVVDLSVRVRYRPAAALEISAGPRVRRNRLPAQYPG